MSVALDLIEFAKTDENLRKKKTIGAVTWSWL
jgi:hypothetical protein